MGGFLKTINGISRFFNIIAGISLTFLMVLTITDVILRGFKSPVPGTYEVVAFAGAVVIGFSMPLTSWLRGHIFVDFFILKFSQKGRDIFNIVTRCMVIVLFFLIGWNMIKYAMDLQKSGEVSLTLQMPFYPVAYGVGVCCFIQCLVMVCDIVKISGGKYDE
ncbi:MAG: TRAP-type C4-dicarboxylate transport system, small permease component [Deltaproteobacteria bacterium]|jgi:TRAP-type C4-dicarboxylate transport system permease small subunit|nr:TRAP-type C4-dicarboxylate transport system, small permease component [Deltaproteobacteria bacterium]